MKTLIKYNASILRSSIVVIIGVISLLLAFINERAPGQNISSALWRMVDYFTQVNAALVTVSFVFFPFYQNSQGFMRFIAGLLACCIMVASGFITIILPFEQFDSNFDLLANVVSHGVFPMSVLIFWLYSVPKGLIRTKDPGLWFLIPLLYLSYALVRGYYEHSYPYIFLDANALGYLKVSFNVAILTVLFFAISYGLLFIDKTL